MALKKCMRIKRRQLKRSHIGARILLYIRYYRTSAKVLGPNAIVSRARQTGKQSFQVGYSLTLRLDYRHGIGEKCNRRTRMCIAHPEHYGYV